MHTTYIGPVRAGLLSTVAAIALMAEGPLFSDAQAQTLRVDEIVVTAQRREQNLQEVPSSLQVFQGDLLERLGVNDFDDYMPSVAGAGYTKLGSGTVKLGMRGVSNLTGSQFGVTDSASTVGLYLNDIPIQGTASLPDLAIYDLSRIEVLKGPQGTLYGEGAMGGAIKMILNSPDPTNVEAKGDVTLSHTESGGFNYLLRSAVNVPLIQDRVGLRLVGTYRDNSGFVDNIAQGVKNINDESHWSLRGLLGAELNDWLSAEVLVMHDRLEQDDFSDVRPQLGDLVANTFEDRYNNNTFDLYALTLKADLGGAELTSATSYAVNDRAFAQRYPLGLDSVLVSLGAAPVGSNNEALLTTSDQKTFTQEIRLASNDEGRLQWTVGAFYRDRRHDFCGGGFAQSVPAFNAALVDLFGAGAAPFLFTDNPYRICTPDGQVALLERFGKEKFEQYALYGEATYDITDRLDFTLGLRWYQEDLFLAQQLSATGVYAPASTSMATLSVSDNGIVPRFALSYKATDDVLLFASASQGFRSGGPNLNSTIAGPALYDSDKIWNYEVGSKTSWFDGRLVVNGSFYYIDWSDIQALQIIQVQLAPPPAPPSNVAFTGNGGKARIYGIDLEILAQPSENWQFGTALSISDGKLTDPADTTAAVGSALPNHPEETISAFVQYSHPVSSIGTGFIRFEVQHVAKQAFVLDTPQNRALQGGADIFLNAYELGKIRIGLDAEHWGVHFYVDNLWDERADLAVGNLVTLNTITVNQPRTIGVTFLANF